MMQGITADFVFIIMGERILKDGKGGKGGSLLLRIAVYDIGWRKIFECRISKASCRVIVQ